MSPSTSQMENVAMIDERDRNTPDNWIPRNPELIRLTGKHPFNCEPPLPALMEEGFLTPTDLHYVRNHGPVPRLLWDSHRVQISGFVKNPVDISMEQILSLPSVTMPITLVCAGNRRKEQNLTKQSIGFSWGPSAVSTAVWTGVRLSTLLTLVAGGVVRGAKFVCFEGADKLPNGYYGTSINVSHAMTESNDVIIAYKMNGQLLSPDHGFPVRVIIPGMIGGRMVKWLTKILVDDKESKSHYHYFDNRVLPSHVDAETATREGWWFKPDYIINELNINSVISSPAHDEVISVAAGDSTYTMKGYAYSGGGKKVIRVEVSLDGGKVWELTELRHPEELEQYTSQKDDDFPRKERWCWCFWSHAVPISRLARCKELLVRAWDQSQNTQPDRLTWNVMGMMNNSVFRVVASPVSSANGKSLRFQHPTQPGNIPGGWMVKHDEAAAAAAPIPAASPESTVKDRSLKVYALDEIAKHDKDDDCWIIIGDRVYDCTKFLQDHPGGADSILINAGEDCTEEFEAIHSSKARKMLDDYLIGSTGLPTPPRTPSPTNANENSNIFSTRFEKPTFLPSKSWQSVVLIEKQSLSHDTRRFRFALESPEQQFGLPVGKHILLRTNPSSPNEDDKPVIRAYTPTSPPSTKGHFDLVVKIYFAGVEPRFPKGGVCSQYLNQLSIGDSIQVKGPLGSFLYEGAGRYSGQSGKQTGVAKEIGMICGGTGITPLWQVVQDIFKNDGPEDNTRVSLLVGNKSERDILLQSELKEVVAKFGSDRIRIWDVLSQDVPENWAYGVGYIDEQIISEHLFPFSSPAQDSERIVLICGPPPMVNFCCLPALKKLHGSDFVDTRDRKSVV